MIVTGSKAAAGRTKVCESMTGFSKGSELPKDASVIVTKCGRSHEFPSVKECCVFFGIRTRDLVCLVDSGKNLRGWYFDWAA